MDGTVGACLPRRQVRPDPDRPRRVVVDSTVAGRRKVILAAFEKHFPDWNDKVADLVWELRPPGMMPKLGKMITDPKLSASSRARIIDILAASDDRAAGQAMLDVLESDVPAEV